MAVLLDGVSSGLSRARSSRTPCWWLLVNADLKPWGFFRRKAVHTQGITQYWKANISEAFTEGSSSTKDTPPASVRGKKEVAH